MDSGNALRKNLYAAGVFSRAYGYFEVRKARAIVRRSNDRRAAMMNGLHFDPARSRRGFAAPAKGAQKNRDKENNQPQGQQRLLVLGSLHVNKITVAKGDVKE